MKGLGILIALAALLNSPQNSSIDSNKYSDFIQYVTKGFKPTESIKNNCDWQYALVELKVSNDNRIISYTLLNKALPDLANGFKYLIGYKFSKNLQINHRPLVFCLSIENEKKACIDSKKKYSPSEVLGIVFSDLKPAFEENPNLIFIPDIIQAEYSFDSIR